MVFADLQHHQRVRLVYRHQSAGRRAAAARRIAVVLSAVRPRRTCVLDTWGAARIHETLSQSPHPH